MVLIGIVLLVRTFSGGGGPAAQGLVLGVLFVLAGLGRLWVERRHPGP